MQTRFLTDAERALASVARAGPVVVEPDGVGPGSRLDAFLTRHGHDVVDAVHEHGALLFRGFRLDTPRDLQAAVAGIGGMRPMSDYFMSEPGRTSLRGAESVFYTDRYVRTGGTFSPVGGFHNENYYSTDVPAFQAFWCTRAPWLGGETALVHMANVYDELDPSCRTRLESAGCDAKAIPLSDIAVRYGLAPEQVEAALRELGLPLVTCDGARFAVVHKPSVLRHPHTRRLALLINLSGELQDFDRILHRLFLPAYRGKRWALHRLAWRRELVLRGLREVEAVGMVVSDPAVLVHNVLEPLWSELRADRSRSGGPPPRAQGPKLSNLKGRLPVEDVESIARAVRRHCAVFSWRPGDLLLLDNLQMCHAGMPGAGPRELRVMMFNPITLGFTVSSGLLDVADLCRSAPQISLDARLRALVRS